MKNTFLYRRRQAIFTLIFLAAMFTIPLYYFEVEKKMFKDSGGYDAVVVGVIVKDCYRLRNSYGNKYNFTLSGETYEGFGNFRYKSECEKYQKGDSILIEFSTQYPDKFSKLISKIAK